MAGRSGRLPLPVTGRDRDERVRRIQEIAYRIRTGRYRIPAEEVGQTYTFSFDAKRGNINDSGDPNCEAPNVCDSTANAFIKTLDPNAGFGVSKSDIEDTTNIPITWGSFSVSLDIDESLVGHILQLGFQSNASNFEPAGVIYDNVLVTKAPTAP